MRNELASLEPVMDLNCSNAITVRHKPVAHLL